ncbi:2-C-methyl-D-erythritol 4-phosphate cytidylyltransferase [Paludisphaera mucosa]|uniref:2-C-methyl-D-erythritol 4-phosphate cytidylyltransferase n=1 Tax=Paludisphaera mucosa TaxID=3030827 RepID=A0ABT6F835_9BACT|nr:2-C-methyl-D-erythritol 4-phosphate cytidylyltransferase [Paludisphaera mucosa]MDG3003757.1 2-C-methyl-D-erythritol 4-phosphate cytidylyltransferase [Paludisphaera mucosa]
MRRFAVILPAAGRSTRFGDARRKKIYTDLEGRAVWLRSVQPFLNNHDVGQIIVAIAEDDREMFESRYRDNVALLGIDVVVGGAERADTVAAALAHVKDSCDFVAVHDAARPCLTAAQVVAVFALAEERGAAMLAVPVADTIKRVEDGVVVETVSRDGLYLAQTPQVFRRDWLVEAYEKRDRTGKAATDDARLVEALGRPIAIVAGSAFNLKITTQDDLRLARAVLAVQEEESSGFHEHPFPEEQAKWEGQPKMRPSDLFES